MSLLVWIPMVHGNCKDQGLLGVETSVVNTVTYVDGKLGKAAQIGNGNQVTNGISINTNLVEELGTQYSCSVWVKPLGNHVHYEGAIISSGDWNKKCWAFGVNQDNSKVDIFCGGYNRNVTCSVPINQWTHLVSVNNGTYVNLYKNGELVSTTTASSWPLDSDATNTTIGRETYAGGYFSFNGCIQDLRIYDHALSPLEVKRLAQGLVLHYPLNRGGFGQENLITQTIISTDPWKSAISGSYTVDGKTGWILANNILYSKSGNGANNIFPGLTYDSNTQYTISFKWRDDYRTDGKSSSLYIRFKYSDGTYTQVISPKCDYWKEEVMTSTAGKTVSAITTTYGNGGNLLFTDLKLEKGAIKTPFSPIVNSDEYIAMGLNSTIEYDVSGYGNNGTKVGTITYDSDTPRYNTSTILDGTYISLASLTSSTIPQFSICGWVNLLTGYTANYGCHLINFNKTYCRICISKDSAAVRLLLTDDTTNYSASSVMSASSLSANVWNHYAVTFDNGSIKIYINGELDSSITATITSISPGSSWTIGNHGSAELPKAKVSDVRFYMTCLNESDVRELYNTSMSLSNNGVLFGYEFIE